MRRQQSTLVRDMKIVPIQSAQHLVRVAAAYCWDEWSDRFHGEFYIKSKEELMAEMTSSFSCQCYVAHVDNMFLGTVSVHVCDMPSRFPHLTPWIQSLYVPHEFRRLGIGLALMSYATTNLRRSLIFPIKNDSYIYMQCKVQNIKWYLNQGWEGYHISHKEPIVVLMKHG